MPNRTRSTQCSFCIDLDRGVHFTTYQTRAAHYRDWILRSNLRSENTNSTPITHRRATQDHEDLFNEARSVASTQIEIDTNDILEDLDDLKPDSEEFIENEVDFELGMCY